MHQAVFVICSRSALKGVVLDSWFIPDAKVVPSFYQNTNATTLYELFISNTTLAIDRLDQQLNSFITEMDFKEIATHGFNSVRIPLGYWNVRKLLQRFVILHLTLLCIS